MVRYQFLFIFKHKSHFSCLTQYWSLFHCTSTALILVSGGDLLILLLLLLLSQVVLRDPDLAGGDVVRLVLLAVCCGSYFLMLC